MVELILIRHGVTAWNASHRFQGRSDVPLSEPGRAQARAIAEALRAERLDAVYSSDLSRALETARIVAEPQNVDAIADERLREFDFGQWEGLTWAQIVATRPHLRDRAATAATLYTPEQGESFEEVCDRIRSFFGDLDRRHREGKLAIVTHAGPLHAALAVLKARTSAAPDDHLSVAFSAASVTRIAMEEDGARIIRLDDLRHLDSTRRS